MLLVVTANATNCRVYHYQKHLNKLTLIKEIEHPKSRLKNRDIASDRPGRYNKSASGKRGAYEPPSDPKDNEIALFSRDIAKLLNTAKQDKLYEELILITDSRMLGLLNQQLHKNVSGNIKQTIQRDLQTFSDKELADYLTEHLP